METRKEVPFIKLSGSPRERGITHGSAVSGTITANIEFYKKLLKLSDATIRAKATYFAQKIAAFRPELFEEMQGIAEGAGVEPEYIYMLNARTELLSMSGVVQSECATFYFKNSGLLFENWDWSEPSKDMTVLLSITLPNGAHVLTFTEAGMLGKVGMSSKGFGVAFNYLYPEGALEGLPIHVLLRALLEAESYTEAVHLLTSKEFVGTSGNILLGSAEGEATDFELSGLRTSALPMLGSSFAHTNHYLAGTQNDPEAGEGFLTNSYDRFEHASKLLEGAEVQDIEAAKALLLDRTQGNGMICRDFIPEEPGHTPTGTIASVIMDLPNKKMLLALGPQDTSADFKTFSL